MTNEMYAYDLVTLQAHKICIRETPLYFLLNILQKKECYGHKEKSSTTKKSHKNTTIMDIGNHSDKIQSKSICP